jgi:hypothetical protein
MVNRRKINILMKRIGFDYKYSTKGLKGRLAVSMFTDVCKLNLIINLSIIPYPIM